MSTKTITFGAGTWLYPDIFGTLHTVTTNQSFTFEMTDGGASAVTYQTDQGQSVTTTDGYRIPIFARAELGQPGSNSNARRSWGPTADAEDGVTLYSKRGELDTRCPLSGINQHWRAQKIAVDNVDSPTSITATFEDQRGNTFTWTALTIS